MVVAPLPINCWNNNNSSFNNRIICFLSLLTRLKARSNRFGYNNNNNNSNNNKTNYLIKLILIKYMLLWTYITNSNSKHLLTLWMTIKKLMILKVIEITSVKINWLAISKGKCNNSNKQIKIIPLLNWIAMNNSNNSLNHLVLLHTIKIVQMLIQNLLISKSFRTTIKPQICNLVSNSNSLF